MEQDRDREGGFERDWLPCSPIPGVKGAIVEHSFSLFGEDKRNSSHSTRGAQTGVTCRGHWGTLAGRSRSSAVPAAPDQPKVGENGIAETEGASRNAAVSEGGGFVRPIMKERESGTGGEHKAPLDATTNVLAVSGSCTPWRAVRVLDTKGALFGTVDSDRKLPLN